MKFSPEYKAKVKKLAFEMGASMCCDALAFVFFFWADWRVGVGYCFVCLSEVTHIQARQTIITPAQAKEILDEIKDELGGRK